MVLVCIVQVSEPQSLTHGEQEEQRSLKEDGQALRPDR